MKTLGRIFRSLVIVLLVGTLIVCGSFAGVFWAGRSNPQDIYLLGYAFIAQKNDEGKTEMWFVHRTRCENLDNGTGVVYYDKGYRSADTMKTAESGETVIKFFAESADSSSIVAVDDKNIVGEIIAVWQQK